ncbi:MAG TPA: TPM domain-containing protein, partial [Tepidisphaeraceae bacterium]|nr:TPM domain-containing protein [Tepidisphaeraceae bacterium]
SMKPKQFIDQLDDDAVVAAIKDAEAKTSGEIRVFVSHRNVADPLAAAQKHFLRLKMDRTHDRNAVLIFVAPKSHQFAIIGDAAVHAKCGEAFWSQAAAAMSDHFKRSAWSEGIIHVIRKVGDLLAQHFPRRSGDVNQLSDQVERD